MFSQTLHVTARLSVSCHFVHTAPTNGDFYRLILWKILLLTVPNLLLYKFCPGMLLLLVGYQVLQQLHWLPARQRVEFKLAVLRSTTCATTSVRWSLARCHHRAGAVSFDHQFHVHYHAVAPVHVLKIKHPMLPDHAFGTLFLYMSVDLICPWTPSTVNWKGENVFNRSTHRLLLSGDG